ncbi:MAG: copper chaperone PCu(A)C [Pseudomonadota bacterium]
MTHLRLFVLAAAAAAWLVSPAAAHDYTVGTLKIDHPWARPNLPDRPTAAYAAIENPGGEADRLIAASSPAFGRVELHLSEMQDDVMTMRRVEGIAVPADGAVALEPGGFHVMLFDADALYEEGARFPLTLTFERAGSVTVEVAVERRGSGKVDHSGHGGHGAGHGTMDHSGHGDTVSE